MTFPFPLQSAINMIKERVIYELRSYNDQQNLFQKDKGRRFRKKIMELLICPTARALLVLVNAPLEIVGLSAAFKSQCLGHD